MPPVTFKCATKEIAKLAWELFKIKCKEEKYFWKRYELQESSRIKTNNKSVAFVKLVFARLQKSLNDSR